MSILDIPEKVQKLFNDQEIISFGTADVNNIPNVVAVFWKKIINEKTILLIDNYMNQTKKNIEQNSKVCLSFWDRKTGEGYKIKGDAFYHISDQVFDQGKEFIQEQRPEKNPKGVVEVKVKDIYLITPGSDAGAKI